MSHTRKGKALAPGQITRQEKTAAIAPSFNQNPTEDLLLRITMLETNLNYCAVEKIPLEEKHTYSSMLQKMRDELETSTTISEAKLTTLGNKIDLLGMAIQSDAHEKTISRARGKLVIKTESAKHSAIKPNTSVSSDAHESETNLQKKYRPNFFSRLFPCKEEMPSDEYRMQYPKNRIMK